MPLAWRIDVQPLRLLSRSTRALREERMHEPIAPVYWS